jgi:hypothetical protein
MAADEDPESEARRFSGLLSLLAANVPELERWRRESLYGDEFDSDVLTFVTAYLVLDMHLFDDLDQPIDVHGVWPRLLSVIEVALELRELLGGGGRDTDSIAVDAFAGAGLICDITRNVALLQRLLPLMGPQTLDTVRIEIASHTASRGYDAADVDWSNSGIAYTPLGISPQTLIPAYRA